MVLDMCWIRRFTPCFIPDIQYIFQTLDIILNLSREKIITGKNSVFIKVPKSKCQSVHFFTIFELIVRENGFKYSKMCYLFW